MLENGTDIVSPTAAASTPSPRRSAARSPAYAAIENLTLVNVATALNGIGNGLNNVINGNNFLLDTLSGGATATTS